MKKEFDEIIKVEIVLNILNLLLVKANTFRDKEIFKSLNIIKNKIYYNYDYFNYEKLYLELNNFKKKLEIYDK